MSIEDNFLLGVVKKSRGLKGELLLSLTSAVIEFEKRIGVIWLGDNPDHLQPWEVEYFHVQRCSAILKLKNVNSRDEADYLKGIKVFIPSDQISHNSILHLIGYHVQALSDGKLIGTVREVDMTDMQTRLIVETAVGEMLIPLVDEFIEVIDDEKKRITVKLIEGFDTV
ncbi:MAG: 16S rRNA processing protein RimM [Candidatus Marinimicrobia bacterium]|nr:16S rRNA processing protein RimM [Candidatus Neomarinimicrobiota bacterium]